MPPDVALGSVQLEDPPHDVAHRVALGVGRGPEHGGDELLGLAAPEAIVRCLLGSGAGEHLRRSRARLARPDAARSGLQLADGVPVTPRGSKTLISPRCSRSFTVARSRSVLTDETMAGPAQAPTPVDQTGGLARLRRPEHRDGSSHASAAARRSSPSVERRLPAPPRQHEAAGLRLPREQGSEIAGGGQACLGLDAEPAALVGRLVAVRSESLHHDRGDRDCQQDDDDDGQPVDDGTGEVRARRLVPGDGAGPRVARKARERAEGVAEPGVAASRPRPMRAARLPTSQCPPAAVAAVPMAITNSVSSLRSGRGGACGRVIGSPVRGSRSAAVLALAGVERSDDVVEGLAVGVARLDRDGVEVVLVAAAGEARVAELGVEGVVAEEEGDLAGEALGLVDGPGVAVLQVVG